MALSDDIQLLAQVPLFQGLESDQLRLIAFGAEHRNIPKGRHFSASIRPQNAPL